LLFSNGSTSCRYVSGQPIAAKSVLLPAGPPKLEGMGGAEFMGGDGAHTRRSEM
jgi:hypothetical protein